MSDFNNQDEIAGALKIAQQYFLKTKQKKLPNLEVTSQQLQVALIMYAMDLFDNNISQASKFLCMNRSTLSCKLTRYLNTGRI